MKKSVYNVNYEEIGRVKDIFGPFDLPFISIKTVSDQEFEKNSNFYIRLNK